MPSTAATTTATATAAAPPPYAATTAGASAPDNGSTLIARAEALNAFMRMQPAAQRARDDNVTSIHSQPPAPTTLQPQPHPPQSATAPSPPPPLSPHPTPTTPHHNDIDNSPHATTTSTTCLCFGRSNTDDSKYNTHHQKRTSPNNGATPPTRPRREYYPDNLSVQPNPHPWSPAMEWLIVASIDFLEQYGLHEQNIFAVSAVDHLVRGAKLDIGCAMSVDSDPHVAAGIIKDRIRHADEPLVDKECLRTYIEALGEGMTTNDDGNEGNDNVGPSSSVTSSPSLLPSHDEKAAVGGVGDGEGGASTDGKDVMTDGNNKVYEEGYIGGDATSFRNSLLATTVSATRKRHGARRAYVLARFVRLLGRVSANIASSRMNAHSLAKCVGPSMLHWDPNANFALLMLGRITAYVKTMVEEARAFDEQLCTVVDDLFADSGGW